MATSNSCCVNGLSEDKILTIIKWCNSMFAKGISVKLLNINKISVIPNIIHDTDSNTIWLISNELSSALFFQYNTTRENLLKLLASLREEFLNGSSNTVKTFYEFTITGTNELKRPPQIHYLDLSESPPLSPSQISQSELLQIKKFKEEKIDNDDDDDETNDEESDDEGEIEQTIFLTENITETKIIEFFSNWKAANSNMYFILRAQDFLQKHKNDLTLMVLKGRPIKDDSLHFYLSDTIFCIKNNEMKQREATNFEDYFLRKNESDIDSSDKMLLYTRTILEGEGNLLDAIMEGAFINFNIDFTKTKNSRVSDTLCYQIMDKLTNTLLRNCNRDINVLESKFDDSVDFDSKVYHFWTHGNWRENKVFSDDNCYLPILQKKDSLIKREFDQNEIRHFYTFLNLWKNLEYIRIAPSYDETTMSYAVRERCLVNIYVIQMILRFLRSRFLNTNENMFFETNLSNLYYTVIENISDRQVIRDSI